jgi:hypothetical protein
VEEIEVGGIEKGGGTSRAFAAEDTTTLAAMVAPFK